MAIASWFYATVWQFTTQGRKELLQWYSLSMGGDPAIKCRFLSDTNIFEIECLDTMADGPFARFVEIIQEYIERNRSHEFGIKIFRLIESQAENDDNFQLEEYERLLAGIDDEQGLFDLTANNDIKDNTGYAWNPQYQDTDVAKVFNEGVLEVIVDDTGCPMWLNVEKRCVLIKGAACLRAAAKLARIERNAHRTKVADHVVYGEKLVETGVQLTRLVDQQHPRLLRTLVTASDETLRTNLPYMRSARFVRWDEQSSGHVIIHNEPTDPGLPDQKLIATWANTFFSSSSIEAIEISVATAPVQSSNVRSRQEKAGTKSLLSGGDNNSIQQETRTRNDDTDRSGSDDGESPHSMAVNAVPTPVKRHSRFDVPPPHVKKPSRFDVPPSGVSTSTKNGNTLPVGQDARVESRMSEDLLIDVNPSDSGQAIETSQPRLVPPNSPVPRPFVDLLGPLDENVLTRSQLRLPVIAIQSIPAPLSRKSTIATWASGVPPSSGMPPNEQAVLFEESVLPGDLPARAADSSYACVAGLPKVAEFDGRMLSDENSPLLQRSQLGDRAPPSTSSQSRSVPGSVNVGSVWSPGQAGPRELPNGQSTRAQEMRVPLRYEDTPSNTSGWEQGIVKTESLITRSLDAARFTGSRRKMISPEPDETTGLPPDTVSSEVKQKQIQISEIEDSIILWEEDHTVPSNAGQLALQTMWSHSALSTEDLMTWSDTMSNFDDEEICERLQTVVEPDERCYHNVMGQRKGRKNVCGKKAPQVSTAGLPRPEPLPPPRLSAPRVRDVKESVNIKQEKKAKQPVHIKQEVLPDNEHTDGMLRILEHARSFKGYVNVEVQIGQLLLHGFKSGEALNFSKLLSINKEDFESGIAKLLYAKEMDALFTPRLTAQVEEACHLLVPRLFGDGQPAFLTECFFEILLLDKDNREVCARVTDDPSAAAVFLLAEDIGVEHAHFPKRTWDARFAVTGRKDYEIPEDVKKMTSTARVSVHGGDDLDQRRSKLKFRIDSNEISVKAVYSKRRLHYLTKVSPEVKFQVTEVRQHELKQSQLDASAWLADSYTLPVMIARHEIWFEGTIYISRNPLLEENMTLELGDDASWVPQDILGETLLSDLRKVTEQLVTRIDGVGFKNEGIRGDLQDRLAIQDASNAREEVKLGINMPFW